MTLKVLGVRGGRIEEILAKKINVFIGISLGNKWFSRENLREYILWALKYSNEKVLIWVADKIHAVNYEIKDRQKPGNALKRAIKEGDKRITLINEIISELPPREQQKVEIIRCKDLEVLEFHKKRRAFFYKKFKEDEKFKDEIFKIVKSTITLKFEDNELERLSEYVLDELPEIMGAFEYSGVEYSVHPYPVDTKISQFTEKVQNKEIFPEIVNELKFKNMACVQLA